MNLRAARQPRGDFRPRGPRRRELAPRHGFVLPREYAGPDLLRVGQVVKVYVAGGECTPGLSAEMLRNAGMAAAGNQPHSLFEYAGCHYGGPTDAWYALRVVQNPIPLLWIMGAVAATLGSAWTVREVLVDEQPAGAAPAAGPLSGVSVGIGGLPLLAALVVGFLVWRSS